MTVRGERSLMVGLLSALLCLSPSGSWATDDPGQITKYFGPFEAVQSVAGGSDGAVWFTTSSTIGHVVPGGTAQWFRTEIGPSLLALGPDGDMWVTGPAVVAIVRDEGDLTEFLVPAGSRGITSLTLGDDGNMWAASSPEGPYQPGVILRITPAGVFTAFPTGDGLPLGDGSPEAVTAGPDGRIWFIRDGLSTRIVAMTEQGVREEYSLPAGYLDADGLVLGSDGSLWFVAHGLDSDHYGAVVRMQTDGDTRLYPFPAAGPSTIVWDAALGPDGAVWISTTGPGMFTRVDPDGSMAQYPLPDAMSGPYPLTAGPDGGMWFPGLAVGPYVGRVATGIEAQDYAPVLTGSGRVGSPLTCTTKPWPSVWATQTEWVRDGMTMPWAENSYTPTAADEDHEFYCLDSGWREGLLSPLTAFSEAVVIEDPPTVSSVSPQAGPLQGGTLVTVRGAGFRSMADVRIGSKQCLEVGDVSATEVTCLAPPGDAAGSTTVTLINPSGLSASLPGGFTYQPAPTPTTTPSPAITTGGKATWLTLPKRVRVRSVLGMTIRATTPGTVTVQLKGPSSARKVKALPAGDTEVRWRLPKKVKVGAYKVTLLFNGVASDKERLRVVALKRK